MSRLSRGKKREHERAVRPAAPVATPVAVHVPADGAGASVGGVPVRPAPGEEVQQAVLNHLHRIALACGHAVLATVTDERIGYVVPLQVHPDGSSTFTAEPRHTAPPADTPGESAPTAVPEAPAASTFVLRAAPEPAGDTPFGTAAAPTGVFGPPPLMATPPPNENPQPTPPPPADVPPPPAVRALAPAVPGAAAPDGPPVPVDRAVAPAAFGAAAPADRAPAPVGRAAASA
ncbi:tetratricopeptide repeat protein, partial [Streptomyces sp. NPDC007920]